MDKVLERLKTEFPSARARYAYADSVTNAFLTAQIKALRESRGLTQEKLAELVGTKQSGISRWQNSGYSNCKVESLRKFAEAFGVRLRMRFEEFGTLPDEVNGFNERNLTPCRFEDDPAFKDHPENRASAAISKGAMEIDNRVYRGKQGDSGNVMDSGKMNTSLGHRDMKMASNAERGDQGFAEAS